MPEFSLPTSLPVGLHGVVPIAQMAGPDAEATAQFGRWLDEATAYLRAQEGAPAIAETWFGLGVAELLAVFLCRLEPGSGAGEYVWVIAGDVPAAWLLADQAREPLAALEAWCELAQQWLAAVRGGGDLSQVFPLGAPSDEAHVAQLESRLQVVRDEVLPACRGAGEHK